MSSGKKSRKHSLYTGHLLTRTPASRSPSLGTIHILGICWRQSTTALSKTQKYGFNWHGPKPTPSIHSVDGRQLSLSALLLVKLFLPPCLPDPIPAAVSTADFWPVVLAAFVYKIVPCLENEACEVLNRIFLRFLAAEN